MYMVFTVQLKKYVDYTHIFEIILYKFKYEQKSYMVILHLIQKN